MPENFDETLYLEANPDVRAMLARGDYGSALEHWESTGAREHALGIRRSGFSPYDLVYVEEIYLERNDDVAAAVRSGVIRDGYEHWIRFGRAECDNGHRPYCFGVTTPLYRPFRLDLGQAGELLGGLTTPALTPLARVDLSIDPRTTLAVEPRSVAASQEFDVTDDAGGVTKQTFLLFWLGTGILPSPGSAPQGFAFTVTEKTGEASVVNFPDVTEGPLLTSIDAACELVRTAGLLHGVSGHRDDLMRAVGSLAGTRLSPPPLRGSQPLSSIHVEQMVTIPGAGVFAVGWLIPGSALLERCRAFCPETGECFDFLPNLTRSARPDVQEAFKNELGGDTADQFGFAVLLALPEASRSGNCTVGFGITPLGGQERVGAPLPVHSVSGFIDRAKVVLASLKPASTDFQSLMTHAIGPAMQALWDNERSRKGRTVTVRQFGPSPARPATTVVVPIYGRSDFIRYQLALFANDEDFTSGATELIYFIDDPRLIEGVLQLCLAWAPLYRVSFTVAYTGYNHGFSGANNLGVSVARGDMVVLLNSDAMPKRIGWVRRMMAAHASVPDCGLLGVKLLYYDESLQHDGMLFEKFPFWNDLYGNNHPGKGLPNRDESKAPPRDVEAVTGACLAISRALYLEVGGLCEEFVLGDFEDSELCMRLRHAGKRIVYMPSEELYHLERQSQSLLPDGESWRFQLTVYNSWVQDRKWRRAIDDLKRSRPEASNGERAGQRG